MRVLVTGGAGLIGMAVRRTLIQETHEVIATDVTDFDRDDPALERLDLTDTEALENLFAIRMPEAIIHCGGISGPMMAKDDPLKVIAVNSGSTATLLDLARRYGLARFVFCSSVSVYGGVGPATITEDTPFHPTSTYGATKVAGEGLIEAFAAEHGVEGVALRIARVYGPYRRANCYLGSIFGDAAAGRETTIPCDPEFAYHYVHVDDVAAALLAALNAPVLPHRAYNVSGERALTMPQIAEIARQTVPGASITLVPGADEVPDVQTAFSIARIARDLGWRPRYDLEAGLKAYRENLLDEYPQPKG